MQGGSWLPRAGNGTKLISIWKYVWKSSLNEIFQRAVRVALSLSLSVLLYYSPIFCLYFSTISLMHSLLIAMLFSLLIMLIVSRTLPFHLHPFFLHMPTWKAYICELIFYQSTCCYLCSAQKWQLPDCKRWQFSWRDCGDVKVVCECSSAYSWKVCWLDFQ